MTKFNMMKLALVAASAAALSPAALHAQNSTTSSYNEATDTQQTTVHQEKHDFPWGLLGLLGLAGLLGRRHKEADIHVDARRDTRDTTRP
jgi:hypothetical protein